MGIRDVSLTVCELENLGVFDLKLEDIDIFGEVLLFSS